MGSAAQGGRGTAKEPVTEAGGAAPGGAAPGGLGSSPCCLGAAALTCDTHTRRCQWELPGGKCAGRVGVTGASPIGCQGRPLGGGHAEGSEL